MIMSHEPIDPAAHEHPDAAHRLRMFLVMRDAMLKLYVAQRADGVDFDSLVFALFDTGDPIWSNVLTAMGVDVRAGAPHPTSNGVLGLLITREAITEVLTDAYGDDMTASLTASLSDIKPGHLYTIAIYQGFTQFETSVGVLPFNAPGGDA